MIGQTISHYKILEKLGEGGMGVVYKAEDTKLHRNVALKFLPQDKLASTADSARFAKEARAAASLNHPNIATIFEFDEVEDTSTHTTEAFIAMEYVEGTTLQKIIKRGPLPLNLITSITIQLATALQTAHKKNIIHRDLKPGNVIMTPDGIVKILDFGLAKLAGTPKTSKDGIMAGTVSYMSPEQLQGAEVDYRTDIWSFGITVYEMLSGKLPFRGEFEPAIMYSILNDQSEPVSSVRPDVPKDLEEVVQMCLQKIPSARAQSMGEIMRILDKKTRVDLRRATVLPRRHVSRKIAMALPGVAILIALAWYTISNIFQTEQLRLTLGIMRFRDETGDSLISDWPIRMQQYLSGQITGAKDIAVLYDEHLNDMIRSAFGSDAPSDSRMTAILRDDVAYLLTGRIVKQGATFGLQATLVETKNGSQLQSFRTDIGGGDQLIQAASYFAEQVLAFFYTEILQSDEDDLAVWKQRTPKNWKALEEFTIANQLIFNYQEAVPRLTRTIELDSTFISPRIWIIPGLVSQKRWLEAQRQYETLLRMKPSANSFESAMIDWAGAYLAKDHAQQARFLREALLSSKNNRILLHNLANSEMMLGNYREAVETLQPCLQTRWRYPGMYRVAGESLLKMGDIATAKDLLGFAAESKPTDQRVYPMLAAIYKKERQVANAVRYEQLAVKEYRERNRPAGYAYELIAGYLKDISVLDSAKAVILRAIEEDPNLASYRSQLGDILFRQGDLAGAQMESEIALRLDSTHAKGHFLLGAILERKGDRPGAIKHYTEFLRLDPMSLDAQFTRPRLRALQR